MTASKSNAAAIASLVLAAGTLSLWAASFLPLLHRHYLSFTPSFHVCQSDGRLVVFNDAAYGPYSGSIVQLSGGTGNLTAKIEKAGFGEIYGIYYRCFRWPDGYILWTAKISFWYALVGFLILPSVWLLRFLRDEYRSRAQ